MKAWTTKPPPRESTAKRPDRRATTGTDRAKPKRLRPRASASERGASTAGDSDRARGEGVAGHRGGAEGADSGARPTPPLEDDTERDGPEPVSGGPQPRGGQDATHIGEPPPAQRHWGVVSSTCSQALRAAMRTGS